MKLERRILENEIARQARSYKSIAAAAGVTEKTLQKARAGDPVRPETAGKIARALGLEIENIVQKVKEDQTR